ncbi:MAG TPA: hypothetical protein VG694_02895 [Candidatus Paceibacterota bacterium]|nr:hypothetical protein [Candidatus Paceibacterota bacterium]
MEGKKKYCLFSASRGYMVKMTREGRKYSQSEGQDYTKYGFADLFLYKEDIVRIFEELGQAMYIRRYTALHGSTADYQPVPDLRVRIVGTEIDYPLPEEE